MTEFQAAVVREQLKRFDDLMEIRLENAYRLMLIHDFVFPIDYNYPKEYCLHTYYTVPFLWNMEKAEEIHRNTYINAVKAELMPRKGREEEDVQIGCGYIKPIYKMPLFKGKKQEKSECLVCEGLWKHRLFLSLYHAPNSTREDIDDVISAFTKVWENREELR
jgi:dTDP-4-amino-4,6-dideoxygalactose transaminase